MFLIVAGSSKMPKLAVLASLLLMWLLSVQYIAQLLLKIIARWNKYWFYGNHNENKQEDILRK